MGYVYGSTKKRPVVAVVAPAPVEAQPKPARTVPGRKRGQGKNNKHGNGCGTNNGWAAHKRAGEDVCDPCYRAHREYANAVARAAAARRKAAAQVNQVVEVGNTR